MMRDFIMYLIVGVILPALVAATVSFAVLSVLIKEARSEELSLADRLFPAVGKLEVSNSEICTVSKIGPREFLTAAHCINRVQTTIRGEFNASEGREYSWVSFRSVQLGFLEKPEGKDHYEDWAVLSAKKETPNIPIIEVDCHYTPKIGDRVAYMGFPYTANTRGLVRLYGEGYVSGVFQDTEKKLGGHFTFDAPLAGGSSGSALVLMATGKIIGIVTRVEIGDRDMIGGIAESVTVLDLCEDAGLEQPDKEPLPSSF